MKAWSGLSGVIPGGSAPALCDNPTFDLKAMTARAAPHV